MQRIKFINRLGSEVVFDLNAPYIFWKTDGLSSPPTAAVSTQASGQHGYMLHGIMLESRVVRLTGHIHGKDSVRDMYGARKRLNAVCNPLLGMGTLTYENDAGTWQISAFCSEMPYSDKIRNIQTLTVEFHCPDPLWQSSAQTIISLAYVSGGMRFPVRTPNRFGTLGYRALADNDSDAETPLELLMDGGSLNPVILNKTTGEFIKLSKQLAVSDQLYINTDPEKLEVSLITTDESNKRVKSNAYGYITNDSTLFKLRQGENELTFTSDDENRKVKITITYCKRYVGV